MTESNPEILVNGEREEKQQSMIAAAQDILSSLSQQDESLEDDGAAEKETQAKMQSVFHLVRNQIRSQASVKVSKNSILELVQKVRDREAEILQSSSEPEGKDVNGDEEKQADSCKDQTVLKEEELCAIFEEKLEASRKALKDEFQAQVSQVRKEMQAYTDQALKDLECKMQSHSLQHTHPKEQQGAKAADKKQKPSAAPSLALRRGRVLTRTMTTIIPKTCPPVVIGPRAKSETLSSSKGESSRFPLRDPVFSSSGNKPYQSRKPLPQLAPHCNNARNRFRQKLQRENDPVCMEDKGDTDHLCREEPDETMKHTIVNSTPRTTLHEVTPQKQLSNLLADMTKSQSPSHFIQAPKI